MRADIGLLASVARRARAGRDIGQLRMIGTVRRAADKHETPVAIAAIDIAMLVDFKEHARMAERAGNTVTAAVASDAAMRDSDQFGRRDHDNGR